MISETKKNEPTAETAETTAITETAEIAESETIEVTEAIENTEVSKANGLAVIDSGPSSSDLLFLDLELDGLHPLQNHILEIAAVLVTSQLKVRATFHQVIHWDEKELNPSAWVFQQHAQLLDEVKHSSVGLQETTDKFKTWLNRYRKNKKFILAGSSIHQDQLFLKCWMPEILECLHYKIVDVSGIMELAKRWNPDLHQHAPSASNCHRALPDAMSSLELLRFYKSRFFLTVSSPPRPKLTFKRHIHPTNSQNSQNHGQEASNQPLSGQLAGQSAGPTYSHSSSSGSSGLSNFHSSSVPLVFSPQHSNSTHYHVDHPNHTDLFNHSPQQHVHTPSICYNCLCVLPYATTVNSCQYLSQPPTNTYYD